MEQEFKRFEGETQDQYFYRICSMKESLGFTWPQMAEIFNNEFGCNKGDTAYRKRWNSFESIFNANVDVLVGNGSFSRELQDQIDEAYKVKKQVADQRREYNKILTSEARSDHLIEKLIEAANIVPLKNYSNSFVVNNSSTMNEALLCCSDWHFGQVSRNIWNEYNVNICEKRVNKLFDQAVSAILQHNIKTLHIALLGGDSHKC